MRWPIALSLLALSSTPVQAKSATFTLLKVVQPAELDRILTTERDEFSGQGKGTPEYQMPMANNAKNAVEIYSVRYEAAIPELGGKTVIASGMLALPVLPDRRAIPLISYQHGTVFGKYEVPSYAFQGISPAGQSHYDGAYETRYMTGIFAGNGYALMAADYFGMGAGAADPEAYFVKSVTQEANHELYKDVQLFLSSKGISPSHVFLGGWSLGGLNTTGFLERLEGANVQVKATFTASSPADPYAALHGLMFHPRPGLDAPWTNTILALTVFSAEKYHNRNGLARSVIHPKFYDDLKSVYDRSYGSEKELYALLTKLSGIPLLDFFREEYRDPTYLRKSEYGRLLADAETYRFAMQSPVKAFYGSQDEVIKEEIGRLPGIYQGILVGDLEETKKNPVQLHRVVGANHRLTFITAAPMAKAWMDSLQSQAGTHLPDK